MAQRSLFFGGSDKSASNNAQGFFLGSNHEIFNDEEEIERMPAGDPTTEYDDEKNDETFGDIGPLTNEWEKQHEQKAQMLEKGKESFFPKESEFEDEDAAHFVTASILDEVEDLDDEDDDASYGEAIIFKAPPPTPPRPSPSHQQVGSMDMLLQQYERGNRDVMMPSLNERLPLSSAWDSLQRPSSQDLIFGGVTSVDAEVPPAGALSAEDLEQQFLQSLLPPVLPAEPEPVPTKPAPVAEPSPAATATTGAAPAAAAGDQQQRPFQKRIYAIYNTYVYNPAQLGRNHYGYFPIYKKSFADSKMMSSDEIENVIRGQMTDLQITNPFLEDYYYCVYMNNKNPSKRIPQNFIQWVTDAHLSELEEEPRSESHGEEQPIRFFGRIPSWNVRAPRFLINVQKPGEHGDKVDLANVAMNKDPSVKLHCSIENGIELLLQIEDLCLSKRFAKEQFTRELQTKLDMLCSAVLQHFHLAVNLISAPKRILDICERPKGLKFVCKALRVLPELYSVLLVQACLTYWTPELTKLLATHEDTLQKLFSKELCYALSQLSVSSLCGALSTILHVAENKNERLWSTAEGRKFCSVIFNRSFEIQKKDKHGEWKALFNKLFDKYLRGKFLSFVDPKQHGGNTQQGWEFLIDVVQHASAAQRRTMKEELKSLLNNTQSPEIRRFLSFCNTQ